MGHLSHHKSHRDLANRLDQMPLGFPQTEQAMEILRLLFTPAEAEVVARMPFRPRPARFIARRLGRPQSEVVRLLEKLADRGLILDMYNAKRQCFTYCVAPPVVGFFEFSLMRVREDLDQRALAHAFEAYLEAGDSLMDNLAAGTTTVGRTLVHEESLEPGDLAELLTYERATEVVSSADAHAVSLCYCRHKAEHLGKRCTAPLENCLSLHGAATMLSRHGHATRIDRTRALELLDGAREANLVFIGDNVQRRLTYICSCCACCCGQLTAISRHGLTGAVKTSGFSAVIDAQRCTGCGRCARRCPVQAIRILALPPHIERKARMYSVVDPEGCLGCGLCKSACKKGALKMERRGARVLTPEGTLERVVTMALERNRLQHLLFDDEEGLHMVFLNRLVGAVLGMPVVRRALLAERLKSRFVGFLASTARGRPRPSNS